MVKILLVQSFLVEQFGIMTLASVAKTKGHNIALAVGSDDHILSKAREFKPDIVGFTVMTGYQDQYLKLGQAIKKSLNPAPIILFGGPHATFFPKVVMEEGVDIVCRGEGEGALEDVLTAIERGNNFEGIKNLALEKNGEFISSPMRPLVDLDDVPFPDRDIYEDYPIIAHKDIVTFMASRGCPFSCSFCFNNEMVKAVKGLGSWVRFRSVDNLIEEIDRVRKQRQIKYIDFHDDTFILKRKWLFEFLQEYARKFSIPFICHIRADMITLDMAKALKKAGCYRVSFGLESGDERLRNEVLKKRLSDNHIREAAAVLKQANLPFFTTNMMGLPGERLEEALKTLELNIEIGTKCAWTGIFQPFPGTELMKYCLEKGYLEKPVSLDKPVDTYTHSLLRQPDIDKIVRLQKYAYIAVRFPGTLPVIKKLINYKMPTVNYYVHWISYLFLYFRKMLQTSLLKTIQHALYAWRHYR